MVCKCFNFNRLGNFSGIALPVFVLSILLAAGLHAQQISIFTANAAGEAITTAEFIHDFDTTVRNDGVHTLASGTNIQMSAGHHLVMYNSRFDSTGGGNRSEMQTKLNLNGVDLAAGWSQSYIRRGDGQDESINAGGAIIDVPVAGQVLQLKTYRTDNNGGALVQREPAATGIQLLKLDDDDDYLRIDAVGANQSLPGNNSTWTKVNYHNEREKDAGSFAFTASGSDITLVQQGHYLVMANTYVFESAERDGFVQRLTLDGAEVSGSRTTVYIRGNQQSCSEGAASLGMIIETTAPNQILNVQLLQDVGRTAHIVGDKTALSIVKLPENGEYIRIEDTSGDQDINAAQTLVYDDAESQLELDATFSHNTGANPGQVSVTAGGDYLFFAQQYDDNDEVQRVFYNMGWQVNGAGGHSVHGQTGRYGRNSGGADKLGNWAGFITGLSASDSIETLTRPLGRSGSNTATSLSLQGMRVDNVLGPDVYPPSIVSEYPADDSNNAYIGTDLVLTFDEDIALTGSGSITLVADPGGTPSNTVITLPNGGVTVSGNQLTIDPAASLASGTDYAVQISGDALRDVSVDGPNVFPGISDTTTWNFRTGDLDSSPPAIVSTSPVDNALSVAVDKELIVTFDDPLFVGSGNIYIYDVTNGAIQQTIPVTDASQVSVSGNTMTITPSIFLGASVELAVQWDAGIVRNFSDIGNDALSDTTTWSFFTSQAPLANSITIDNPGFELPDLLEGADSFDTEPTSWVEHNDAEGANTGDVKPGVHYPTGGQFTSGVPEGTQATYIEPQGQNYQGGLKQVLNAQYISGPDYQLRVRVGNSTAFVFTGYRVQLLAGGTILAEDVNSLEVGNGQFVQVVLEYPHDPANAALNGEPLEIRLLGLGYPAGGGACVYYDDVQLTYGYINPAANTGGPYVVTQSFDLELDATGSRASDGQTISSYEWDLNNDGVYGDVANVAQPTTLTFAQLTGTHGMTLGDNTISLRVTDTAGKVAVSTTNVRLELSSVTPGADFVLDAREDPDTSNNQWEDIAGGNPSGLGLLLDTPSVSLDTAVVSATQINRAYSFPGGSIGNTGGGLLVTSGTADAKSFQNAPGDWSVNAMSMEIWFRPDDKTLQGATNWYDPDDPLNTNGQIIFEDGGGSGMGLFIDNAGKLVYGQDANSPLIAYDLVNDLDGVVGGPATDEFIQVVITRTQPGVSTMYINGQSLFSCTVNGVDFQPGTVSDDTDWSGGDPAAFGTRGGSNTGGLGDGQQNTESFDGKIAIVRVYNNQVLTAGQVLENYNAVSSPDVTAPFVENTSPDDDATNVLVKTNLVATFDSDVQLISTGTVTLKNLDDGSGASDITINISDGSQISLSGRDLIINPTADLAYGTNYAVRISNDAVEDTSNNAFAGIGDDTSWNFRTVDNDPTAPVIVGMNPPDNASAVPAAGVVIEATFDDDLLIGSGNVEIWNIDSTPVIHTTIPIGDDQVAVSGNKITITPALALVAGSAYSVRMDSGVVTNTSYLDFGGIAGDTFWNFTLNSPLFFDGFESPDVTAAQSTGNTSGAVDTAKWVRATAGFGSTRCGIVDETAGAFTDPTGEQAFAFRYTNSGLTTKQGAVGSFVTGTTYTISFDVVADGSALPYDMKLLAVPTTTTFLYYDVRSNGDATQLASRTGSAPSDGSYQTISFDYTATAQDNDKDIVLRFRGATTSASIDNVSVTLSSAVDTTPPDVVDITNPGGEADMTVGETEVFTVSFSEDIDAITVMADDFTNFGTASYTIGNIEETGDNTGVFTVPVTMTGTGTFQLQIVAGAVIKDMAGNTLDTSADINDDVTINVVAGANPYDGWAAGFAGLSNTSPGVDFDGGGLATGLEWVLGGDPTSAADDKTIRPTFDGSGASTVTFTFRRADAALADSNTTIAVEYGSNMTFGSTAQDGVDGVTFGVNDDGAGTGIDIVTVTLPKSLATGGKLFVRLKVTVTTP